MNRIGKLMGMLAAACALALPASAVAQSPAPYRVGVAVETIDPSYPVFMGGYGGGPSPGTQARFVDPVSGRPEHFSVRAMAIESAGRLVELARVDSQGWFAGYVEGPYGITDVRQAAAAYLKAHGFPSETSADILVSTLHQHAAPSIQGIWGPPAQALPYLKAVAAATTKALEEAAARTEPADITWGSLDVPWVDSTNLNNANANEGWPNDGSLLALWARNHRTGRTIATYVSEPAYPNIVYGPGDLKCPGHDDAAQLSTDFVGPTQDLLEERFGGTALVASGTLGDQPGPMQGDGQASRDLPTVQVAGHACEPTVGFDDAIHMSQLLDNLTAQALSQGHSLGAPRVAGSEQYILSPVYNPLLLAINNGGTFDGGTPWTELGNPEAYPVDRSTSPPYEDGNLMGTWVTGLRLGDIVILSEPGEFFPSIHQAWNRSIRNAAGVFVVGMGQDQLGYDFPAYAYPFTYYSADQNIYNPSLTLADQVVTAGEQDARALGFKARLTSTAEQTALDNQYARILQPGVQLMPFTQSGDLDPTTGSFTPTLEGWATPQRYDLTSACQPPVVPGPPSCPLGSQPQIQGPVHWTFGDGTKYDGTNSAQDQTTYFHHAFCTPGTYDVTVTATDTKGQTDTATLPVQVNPALRLAVARSGRRLIATPSGGDGHPLLTDWRLPDGSERTGDSVPATPGTFTVSVLDGTGETARLTGHLGGGRFTVTGERWISPAGTSSFNGAASNACG